MRESYKNNYNNISIIGNNVYDMTFTKYLFESQGLGVSCNNTVDNNTLYNMAYYFGSMGPILINDEILNNIFTKNNIPLSSKVELNSNDIINILDNSINSDGVYVCNKDGNIDKYTMFILGYLMAHKQEIFFWNDIDASEWLMSSICRKNSGSKEFILPPLEIVRLLSIPYMRKKYNIDSIPKERMTEFNLDVKKQDYIKGSVCLLGSLNKHLKYLKEISSMLAGEGYNIIAPKLTNIKTSDNGFIIFEDDISSNPITIESDFIEKCLMPEKIYICNKDGYIGNTVMFEIGYLLASNKEINFLNEPTDKWVMDVVNHYKNNVKSL